MSAAMSGSAVKSPKSSAVAGLGVVVAGADVDVTDESIALASHDEGHLGVHLEVRHPVDDVDAGLFHRARPFDVAVLVEAGFSSTRQTLCLPSSAARISAGTSGESSSVR